MKTWATIWESTEYNWSKINWNWIWNTIKKDWKHFIPQSRPDPKFTKSKCSLSLHFQIFLNWVKTTELLTESNILSLTFSFSCILFPLFLHFSLSFFPNFICLLLRMCYPLQLSWLWNHTRFLQKTIFTRYCDSGTSDVCQQSSRSLLKCDFKLNVLFCAWSAWPLPPQWACPHLADDEVGGFKMAAVHLGRLSGNGLDLDADLLAFLGAVDRLVIHLDAGDHADVHKLKHNTKKINNLHHLQNQEHKHSLSECVLPLYWGRRAASLVAGLRPQWKHPSRWDLWS